MRYGKKSKERNTGIRRQENIENDKRKVNAFVNISWMGSDQKGIFRNGNVCRHLGRKWVETGAG